MKRSIYINKDLEKNHKLTLNDLEFKRPNNGISTLLTQKVIGKKLIKSIKKDTLLSNKHINF